MPEFTKDQESASKFYYNLIRFQNSMKDYEEAFKNTQIATRTIQKIDENDQGLTMTEVVEQKEKWSKLLTNQQKIADEKMSVSEAAFKQLRDLLLQQ